MSALVSEPVVAQQESPAPTVSSRPVLVRRNALVALVLGAASSAIGTAYLYRAVSTGATLDWVLCAVTGLIAAAFLAGLLDARTPLLVADDLGIRIRLGRQWRGVPWEAVDHLRVQRRRGISDGRLSVSLDHVERAVEGLDHRARRAVALNRRLYGGLLTVPLGLSTRWGSTVPALADRLELLAAGRTQVVRGAHRQPAPSPRPEEAVEPVADPPGPQEGVDAVPAPPPPSGLAPVRGARRLVAARIAGSPRTVVAPVLGSAAPVTDPLPVAGLPEAEELRRTDTPFAEPGPLRRRRVRRVEAPVIEDFATEPAYDPVIGPDLAAARTRVGLSVDELAERTRIRPHVIESIEVDDFGPCGGDFYARGHIRTLARALGKDAAPMLATFDRRYAGAPPSARRVLEAELATGLTGGARRPGGPSWGLLVTVVLALALVWSIVRLVAVPDPERLTAPPALNGSGGVTSWRTPGARPAPVARPVPTTFSAVNGDTRLVVAGRDGRVVYEGEMAMGESRSFRVVPPVRVQVDDGGVVNVWLAGRDRGLLGDEGAPATQAYRVAAR